MGGSEHKPLDLDSSRVIRHERIIKKDETKPKKKKTMVKVCPFLCVLSDLFYDLMDAFRSMMHDDMMVGAFSHSTAVGKLRKDLPDVPSDARQEFPRYSLDEAEAVCYYYLRQRLVRREVFSEENWKKIYYLANGNGAEMRWLVPFMR
ncbi:unnamed protein product [Brassica oleracea]